MIFKCRMLPNKNAAAPPRAPASTETAVAVVLSVTLNHVFDTTVGIALVTLSAIPLKPCPVAISLHLKP